ncbi:hypothetical protein PENSPDRAFT_336981 [Peniophora sp. CONT]|nr:hypothetical protein PENSPDRAFT_336981 [Peniophora sp. CONT]
MTMNRPSTPPARPVQLHLVKGHRLVVSIDDPDIDCVDIAPGRSGPAHADLTVQVVSIDDDLQTQLTMRDVEELYPPFPDSQPSSPTLDYSDSASYESSYVSKYNRYPPSIPPSLESCTAPTAPRSPPPSTSETRVEKVSVSQADIEFKAGLLAHISEFCAARQCPVPVELARAAIRCKQERIALVEESD